MNKGHSRTTTVVVILRVKRVTLKRFARETFVINNGTVRSLARAGNVDSPTDRVGRSASGGRRWKMRPDEARALRGEISFFEIRTGRFFGRRGKCNARSSSDRRGVFVFSPRTVYLTAADACLLTVIPRRVSRVRIYLCACVSSVISRRNQTRVRVHADPSYGSAPVVIDVP